MMTPLKLHQRIQSHLLQRLVICSPLAVLWAGHQPKRVCIGTRLVRKKDHLRPAWEFADGSLG